MSESGRALGHKTAETRKTRRAKALLARFSRWVRQALDNRVLAPRAWVATDPATGATVVYMPRKQLDALPRKAAPEFSFLSGVLPAAFGTPVYALPDSMDKRDCEREWREGRSWR